MGKGEDLDPAECIDTTFVSRLDSYNDSKIAQAVLSHPHSDHILQCEKLADGSLLRPALLTCPNEKPNPEGADERLNWSRIENPAETQNIVNAYRDLYRGDKRYLPLRTIDFSMREVLPKLEYGLYYIRPPVCEELHPSDNCEYGNSTSIMLYFRHGRHSVLLPGDMTPKGMKHIIEERSGLEKRFTRFDTREKASHPNWHLETSDQPSLRSLLGENGLSVLVAPHHGLESGFSEDLYKAMKDKKPNLVVISERRHRGDKGGKVDARYYSERGASGLTVEIDGNTKDRRALSTINGHHILLAFQGTGAPKVYANKDVRALLGRANS
jgi:hypothetical protein